MATAINRRLVTLTAPDTFAAERYQGLRLEARTAARRRRCASSRSPVPGLVTARRSPRSTWPACWHANPTPAILLIDADLRRSSVGEQLGIEAGAAGLADLIAGARNSWRS